MNLMHIDLKTVPYIPTPKGGGFTAHLAAVGYGMASGWIIAREPAAAALGLPLKGFHFVAAHSTLRWYNTTY